MHWKTSSRTELLFTNFTIYQTECWYLAWMHCTFNEVSDSVCVCGRRMCIMHMCICGKRMLVCGRSMCVHGSMYHFCVSQVYICWSGIWCSNCANNTFLETVDEKTTKSWVNNIKSLFVNNKIHNYSSGILIFVWNRIYIIICYFFH